MNLTNIVKHFLSLVKKAFVESIIDITDKEIYLRNYEQFRKAFYSLIQFSEVEFTLHYNKNIKISETKVSDICMSLTFY